MALLHHAQTLFPRFTTADAKLKKLKEGMRFWTVLMRSDFDGKFNDFPKGLSKISLSDSGLNDCLVVYYAADTDKFIATDTSCHDPIPATVCTDAAMVEVDCTTTTDEADEEVDQLALLDMVLNPARKRDIHEALVEMRRDIKKEFRKLRMKGDVYKKLFEILWYSPLPCFDVEGITSDDMDQRSMLKRCYWKGKKLPCSAIFTTFPTDRGMCCTFNMQRADEIFKAGSSYEKAVANLQKRDANMSFLSSKPPDWYEGEPEAEAGLEKGLTVILDAHTDMIQDTSVAEDFKGFIAVVNSNDGYPLTRQNSMRIRPGHDNLVAMGAIDVRADKDDIGSIGVDKRLCYFEDETAVELDIHNRYTRENCILECEIAYGREKLMKKNNASCSPWYLPSTNDLLEMCDPWLAKAFRDAVLTIPRDECSHCLPACQSTSYQTSITAVPFRRCDNKNLGISKLCTFTADDTANPPIFARTLLEQYKTKYDDDDLPEYVTQYADNVRMRVAEGHTEVLAHTADRSYDAYTEDIATVSFFFDKSTVFQYKRKATMTMTQFISQVGGLLGLCLGFSIASLLEMIYWFGFRFWFNIKTSDVGVVPTSPKRRPVSMYNLAKH